MTHAWLIIAHNEFGILQQLISALDAPECDIFVHIDRKVPIMPVIQVNHSNLVFLHNRIDVHCGSVSQIRCEYALFEAATANRKYDYYHIISGTTLLLKPLVEIEAFFEANMSKNIFCGLCQDHAYQETLKVRRYNLFLRGYSSHNALLQRTSQFFWKVSIAIQRFLGIEANRGETFFKASNWVSVTDEAVQYLISRKKDVLKRYRFSFCGDEYFIPSELMNPTFKDTLFSYDHYLLHNIYRSNASVFHLYQYEDLCKTGFLFARKFTEE